MRNMSKICESCCVLFSAKCVLITITLTMFPKRLFSTQGNALSKTIHRSINTHPIKQNPFMKHQSETIPTSPDVLRANYLHKYKLEYTEKYLGEDIVRAVQRRSCAW